MEKVRLGDVCERASSNYAQKDLEELDGRYPVYGASGFIKNIDTYHQEKEYVAVVKDGAGIGRTMFLPAKSSVIGTLQYLLPKEDIEPQYLYFAVKSMHLEKYYTGATIPHIYFKDYQNEMLYLPSKEKQREIIKIFAHLESMINDRKEQLLLLDTLIKSRFVEMFGDLFVNENSYTECNLEELADIVSGITKGRKTSETDLVEVPYMAVSNVKDGYIDWTTVKTIFATKAEVEQYKLMPDDILMTEGGDPDKVGRGAIIRQPLKNCIHQNHIFRVRLDRKQLVPEFFEQYLQNSKAKRYFLGCAKQTTGIASINMGQLRKMSVLMPPLELQEQFAAFVQAIDKSKFIMK